MSAAIENELDRLRAKVERLEESLRNCHRSRDSWKADAISQYARDHLGGLEQEAAEIYAAKLRRQAEGES